MAKVILRKDENLDGMIRRFKKQVIRDETVLECRKHEYFRKKSIKRKEKAELARKKASKNYNPKF